MSSPPRIPAPNPAFTVSGTSHDTYLPPPSSYARPPAPAGWTAEWQPISVCNLVARPFRLASPEDILPTAVSDIRPPPPSLPPPSPLLHAGIDVTSCSPWHPTSSFNPVARPYRPASPEDISPTDDFDTRPPPPSLSPPPPLLNAGIDAASLHPPRPTGAPVLRPHLPTHPPSRPPRTPGPTVSTLDKPPLSFPDSSPPVEKRNAAVLRRRRKKLAEARKADVAKVAKLFARTFEQALQQQNSKHVSTTRLLAAQLATATGKRPASPSTATPTPAAAVRFRPLPLVISSSRIPYDIAAGPTRSAPGTSNHTTTTARHRGQPPIRDRPRPPPPPAKKAAATPGASIPAAPTTSNWVHHSSDSGEFTPKSPSVSPPEHGISTPPPGSAPLRRPLVRFSLVLPAPLGMRHKEALYISHGPPEPVVDLPWVGSAELRRNKTSRPAQRSPDSD